MIGRLVDSLITAVNPIAGLRRMQARKVIERSYQGAEPSRVSSSKQPKNNPADIELMGPFGADRLRAWARELVRNNSYAWGVVDTIVSSVVGCGIKAQSTFETPAGDDVEAINDARDKVWGEWSEVCDINGIYTLEEMQAIAQREIAEAGEVLVRKLRLPSTTYRGIYRPVPLALEIIEADRLAGDKDTYASGISPVNSNRIVRGVEVDELGKPVAYWIYKDHPLQPYAFTRTPERVPANEILHLFRRERVGQTRGVSWFAPALSWIRDLGTYVDNELQASAVASCFTVAIKTETPVGNLTDPDGGDGFDKAGNRERYIEPGMIMELNPGESVEGLNPGRPNTGAKDWIQLILRGIAVGTGLSYEVVARDYSQTSYSSSRTSQLEDRRRFRCWQQYLIRHMLQPIWDEFFNSAAISALPGFPTSEELLSDRRRYAPVEWLTPDWEWVDPSVEQQTAELALNSFTDTYANVLGSRGRSFRQVFYQRAKEDKLRKKLGLLTNEEKQLEVSAAQSGQPVADPQAVERRVQRDCGIGPDGFEPGNKCASGDSEASIDEPSVADDPSRWDSRTKQAKNKSFSQEKTVGDYTYKYIPPSEKDPFGPKLGYVWAFDKNANVVGFLAADKDSSEKMKAVVEVAKPNRRKGIATEMYNFAESITGQKFTPEETHTKAAEAFWKNRKKDSEVPSAL